MTLSRKRYFWAKAAAEIFFPYCRCINCNTDCGRDLLCPDCRKQLDKLRSCPDCASFIHNTESKHYRCAACRKEKPPFAAAHAAGVYHGQLRTNLLNFKYHGRTGLRRPLAALLLDTYQRHWHNEHFDVIIPLPLSAQRAAYRGYNQSQLLSEIVAAELNIAHRPQLLYRTKDTRPLAKLTREERRKELKGAFAAEKLDGQRILLIDDIYTSGASSTTATEVLLKAGAQSVHVLTCAAGYDL